MNKLITTLTLTVMMIPVFSAFQYIQKDNGSGTFSFTGDTTLSVYMKNSADLGSFGFYNLGDGQMIEAVLDPNVAGKAVLGDFKAGDSIAIWAETSDGKVFVSIDDWNNGTFKNMNYNAETGYYELGWDSTTGGPNFEFSLSAGPAPSGQPLPGVIASLLLGGAGIAGLRKMKKKAQKV